MNLVNDDERLLRVLKTLCRDDYSSEAVYQMYRRIKKNYDLLIVVEGRKYRITFVTSDYPRFNISLISKYCYLSVYIEIFRLRENRIDWDDDSYYWEDTPDGVKEKLLVKWKSLKRTGLSKKIEDILRKSSRFRAQAEEWKRGEKRAMRYA